MLRWTNLIHLQSSFHLQGGTPGMPGLTARVCVACVTHTGMYPLNAERAGDVPRIKQFAVVHAGIWLYACDVKTSVDVT